MNPEIAKEWCAALRSGGYKQGKGKLRLFNGELCCLGVLCIIGQNKGVIDNYLPLSCMAQLPESVQQWSGIKDPLACIGNPDEDRSYLAWQNDNGKTFSEIADIIEQNVERL